MNKNKNDFEKRKKRQILLLFTQHFTKGRMHKKIQEFLCLAFLRIHLTRQDYLIILG